MKIPGGFSQNGEDIFIDHFLHKEKGFYVDVGADDGFFSSNTFYFYLRGWHGICIEPDPGQFEKLKMTRPQDELIDLVISDKVGEVDFHLTKVPGWSSLKLDTRMRSCLVQTIRVKSTTLNNIIPNGTEIDLLDIDTEASELEVLAGTDLTKIRPKLILIEYERRGKKPYQSILPELTEILSDYKLVRTFGSLNALFVRT